jgi:hypothetical protein
VKDGLWHAGGDDHDRGQRDRDNHERPSISNLVSV